MKKIYIIISTTGTILSKIIRTYTRDEFAHASISLDKELKQIYSFGRLNPYNAFHGGFVHEYIDKGTFKRFKNTVCNIYELEIEDNQYEKIKDKIKLFSEKKDNYKFNTKGLFAVGFNKRIQRENYFYCAEFVKYVLDEAEIKLDLPEMIRPEDLKKIGEDKVIYKGLLREYK